MGADPGTVDVEGRCTTCAGLGTTDGFIEFETPFFTGG